MNKTAFHLVIAFLFFCNLPVGAQQAKKGLDSLTTAKLSISGFCLCKTTMADLHRMSVDLKEVVVEEMDSPKKCFGEDGRFTNGQGVSSEKFKGMIFQQGNFSDYVGKIRLTKDFSGKLPDGTVVDLQTLKLRDVLAVYPSQKDAWGSRGCSDYWFFSDGIVTFYVRIDSTIQPQFPIKEEYYLDKPVEGIDIVASWYGFLAPPSNLQLFGPDEPMFFIDSIRTNESFLSNAHQPSDFAGVTVIRGENAIKIGGEEARNGLIYIYTKVYARKEYWRAFKTKSAAYGNAVQSPDEPGVVYILNGKVLRENVEADLFNVAKDDSLQIEVLGRDQLRKKYREKGKVGVVLKTL